MALINVSGLASLEDFQNRVHAAIVAAGRDIVSEDPSTLSPPAGYKEELTLEERRAALHDERASLSANVLRNRGGYVEQFAWVVAVNSTVLAAYEVSLDQSDVPDSDVEYVVASVWNAMAIRPVV